MDHVLPRYFHGFGLVLLLSIIFCFAVLPYRMSYVSHNYVPLPPILGVANFQEENSQDFWISKGVLVTNEQLVRNLVEKQRNLIDKTMANYQFHPKLRHIKNYKDLLPAFGGIPVRNMVVTTWRSGSTFLGDLMQSHLASFYHYEPLLPYGITRIREGSPLTPMALMDLDKLMHCNYTNMEHFTNYGQSHDFLLTHNEEVWKLCKESRRKLCFSPDYLAKMCEIYPFQNIKTVRLQTMLTEKFIRDSSLDLHVLLLVRDPRATLQSRQHRTWCPGEPDCDDPSHLCKDLESDYEAYKKFSKKYPKVFKVVRYEDLSFNIYNMSREIFDFFRLDFSKNVEDFLDTHTKVKKGGVSSTYRDSKTAPIHWRSELSWSYIEEIQNQCKKALKLWGYELALNESHALTFDPIGLFDS